MRILLAANASYLPPRGGATRSNLAWLDLLAAAGHECRIVAAELAHDRPSKLEQIRREEIDLVTESKSPEGVEVARRGPILVFSSAEPRLRSRMLREQVDSYRPDWVLVSSEDLGQVLLREASQAAPGRVVYLAHTPQLFPFGPASWSPDPEGAELLRSCAAIVAIGTHTAGYIERHLGCRPEVIHPPVYGHGPFQKCGSFDKGWIAMINPCAVKGISIFLALARRLPDLSFAALPGWGTTAADRRALQALANVTLLPNVKDIGQVLRETRVLLMPSLWYEGFGLSVMEALLRGVPVVSSDSGGLVEAKMGTHFVLPVRPIQRYEAAFDEHGLPNPVVPEQDIGPWAEALTALITDRELYEEESATSHQKGLRFVSDVRPGRMEEFLRTLSTSVSPPSATSARRMRILLAQNSLYYPAHGGGDKSNRLLMEALAERGHDCRVVARLAGLGPEEHGRFLVDLGARGVAVDSSSEGVVVFRRHGVSVHVLTQHPNIRGYFAGQIAEFAPDVILTSTDDPAQLLLAAALRAEGPKVVYLCRTTLAVPFGPDCAFPSPVKAETLRRVEGVVGVSQYVADYIRKWGGIEAIHLPISLLEPGPYPLLGGLENEFVTLVNPCAVKGISIFLKLAERMPEVEFAAVPTWGARREDLAALRQHANVHVLEPVDDIDQLFRRTRVLLVPSLWAEARSRIIPEAMLRGVPVLASNVGGIPEAMLGVGYLLPVKPIRAYRHDVDEQMVPVAEVPEQDVEPWVQSLRKVLTDRQDYERLSKLSREKALAYAAELNVQPFENYLGQVARTPKKQTAPRAAEPAPSLLELLSPEKRRLLALRLHQKKVKPSSADAWFPAAGSKREAPLRLFCFPYAGAGASAYRSWPETLPPGIEVCAARLPGRESRLAEAPFRRMEPLVQALGGAILQYLDRPFAFFGHSMGAGIAFELVRLLRRESRPLPMALLVSSARAPQFRRGHVPPPEPSESEFLRDLDKIDGLSPQVRENPSLLRVVLPALQADVALYRSYVYSEEEPLDCPIYVFGGMDDPNVRREHLEAWREQTTGSFTLQMFPGGHFYLYTAREQFLAELSASLAALAGR